MSLFFLFFCVCRQSVYTFQLNIRDMLYVVMVISEKLKPCVKYLTHFRVMELPLLCQSWMRWSGFYSIFYLFRGENVENVKYQHCFHSSVGWKNGSILKLNSSKSQGHNDWLFVSCVVNFHQLPAVSILWCRLPCRQYAWNPRVPQLSWHVKILSYVDASAIDRRFCSALPPLLLKVLSFKYTEAPRLTLLS